MLPDLVEPYNPEIVQAVVSFEEGEEALDISPFPSRISPPGDIGKGSQGFLASAAGLISITG